MARLTRSRRPWRRVVVLAVLVGLGVAVVTPIWWNLVAEPQRLHWTIEAVGADGRSLRIASGAALHECSTGDPRPHVERDSADEIRIRLVAHDAVGFGDLWPYRERDCPLIALLAGSYTVRLDRAIAGRRIDGPGYRPKLAGRRVGPGLFGDEVPLEGAGDVEPVDRRATMVRVVGLRLEDARRLLRSRGVLEPAVSAPPASSPPAPDAVVVAQSPAVGARLERPARDARRGRQGVADANAARLVVHAPAR